jgi:hypothetical protein
MTDEMIDIRCETALDGKNGDILILGGATNEAILSMDDGLIGKYVDFNETFLIS